MWCQQTSCKKQSAGFSFFALLLLLTSCASSAKLDTDIHLKEKLKSAIEPQMSTRSAGAIIGILDKGSVSYLSFGKKNLSNSSPIDENTLFEIGSLTKTFTSLLFSIAIEKGLVTNETTLSEIRQEWKNQKLGQIKLIELATHRSGLPKLPCNLKFKDERYPYAIYTQKEFINSITDDVIAHTKCEIKNHPSLEIEYSNWGTAILGDAIAKVAHSTYPKLIEEWITKPLNMKDTVVHLNQEQKTRLAQGYQMDLKPIGLWDRKTLFGSGSIRSTAKDLMTYAQAMLHPENTSIKNAILRVQKLQYSHDGFGIGYNWFVTPANNIWHSGMTGGYSSLMKIYFKNDFAVFSLMNTANEINCLIETVEMIDCNPLQ